MGSLQFMVINVSDAVTLPIAFQRIDSLQNEGFLRLVDCIVAAKSRDDRFTPLVTPEKPRHPPIAPGLLKRALFGALDFSLVKNGIDRLATTPSLADDGVTENQLLEYADRVPVQSQALFLLVEHLWTDDVNGFRQGEESHTMANCWISVDLVKDLALRSTPLFG